MEFYCPTCQKTVDQTPERYVTTKLNQQAALTKCQVCGQEMSRYGVSQETEVADNVQA